MLATIGKTIITIGLLLVGFGVLLLLLSRFKIPYLGRLPGDIFIQKKNFIFYFPLATSLIVSAVLSLILYYISKR